MSEGYAIMLKRQDGPRYLRGHQPGDYLWVPAERPSTPRRFHTKAEAEAVCAGWSAARVVPYPEVVETFFLLHCPTCSAWHASDLASAYDFQRMREEHDASCATPAVVELRREVPGPHQPKRQEPAVSLAAPIFVRSKP